ncbi:hypothetical protein POVWA1_022980 [Plasmodium ovale wallikeri]|uniref:Uncharacterized protein n=1 Tax=Plasmodium ovale wallikeri TaxID=864142 RepID=A0A1A8YSV3_PLAOA|nr:hypothetical protein POVWA1_022980 [Plasmodium ovale wallikeri]
MNARGQCTHGCILSVFMRKYASMQACKHASNASMQVYACKTSNKRRFLQLCIRFSMCKGIFLRGKLFFKKRQRAGRSHAEDDGLSLKFCSYV